MNRDSRFIAIVLVVILTACRDVPTSLTRGNLAIPLANALTIDGGPRFSDWSSPENLGTMINTTFADADPSISRDGLSLYFVSGAGRGGSGLRDIWVSHRSSIDEPWGAPRNLGSVINSSSQENRPTLSIDGHSLFFTSNRPGGFGDFDLYVSRRKNPHDDLGWESPVLLGSDINSSSSEQSSVAIFEDEASGERILYFASNRPGGPGGFDIYATRQLRDGSFTPAVIVPDLSTPFDDRDPAMRRDGLELFLASNRPGTNGGLDLWVATRATPSEPWSTAVSLGPLINTPPRPANVEQANDMTPSLSFDGTTLYFASAFRDGNTGFMFDIWAARRSKVTKLEDATWSEPVRLGSAVNTSFNEQGPTLSPDGLSLYFCSNNPLGGQGGNDLWVAHRSDEQSDWGPSTALGPVVNSPNGDCGPNLSADGHQLFFTSNRPGGSGNNDLYVSRREDPNDDFGWEAPVSLGVGVNTPMFEFSPFFLESAEPGPINFYFERGTSNVATHIFAAAISRTGEVTFPAEEVSELNSLAADGHPTMRADGREVFIHSNRNGVNFDIYVSTRTNPNEPWSVPAQVEALNTTGFHEIHPSISRDGRTIVFTRGLGTANDIWMSVRDRKAR